MNVILFARKHHVMLTGCCPDKLPPVRAQLNQYIITVTVACAGRMKECTLASYAAY